MNKEKEAEFIKYLEDEIAGLAELIYIKTDNGECGVSLYIGKMRSAAEILHKFNILILRGEECPPLI